MNEISRKKTQKQNHPNCISIGQFGDIKSRFTIWNTINNYNIYSYLLNLLVKVIEIDLIVAKQSGSMTPNKYKKNDS